MFPIKHFEYSTTQGRQFFKSIRDTKNAELTMKLLSGNEYLGKAYMDFIAGTMPDWEFELLVIRYCDMGFKANKLIDELNKTVSEFKRMII
jgi:hypothetical protein